MSVLRWKIQAKQKALQKMEYHLESAWIYKLQRRASFNALIQKQIEKG